MQQRLPTPDELFSSYFAPWYGPELNAQYQLRVLPDMETIELPKGTSISVLNPLPEPDRKKIASQISQMEDGIDHDWPKLLSVEGEFSMAWLDHYQARFNEEEIANIIRGSQPSEFSNNLLVLTCQLGVAISKVLRMECPRLQWLYEAPYWDSSLFDLNTMTRLNGFHWAIRAMSSECAEQKLSEKVRASVEFLLKEPKLQD